MSTAISSARAEVSARQARELAQRLRASGLSELESFSGTLHLRQSISEGRPAQIR